MKKLIKKFLKRSLEKREFEEQNKKYDINMSELKKLQNEGAIIVDVRSPQEYKEGHIDGAISIPEYEIKKTGEKLLKNKDEKIILYCSSGTRSKKAQKILQKLGYKSVFNLYEGYNTSNFELL